MIKDKESTLFKCEVVLEGEVVSYAFGETEKLAKERAAIICETIFEWNAIFFFFFWSLYLIFFFENLK